MSEIKKFKVYTDGSYDKVKNRGSWGVVVVDENDRMVSEHWGMVTIPSFLEMWNVAGELFAALKAFSLIQTLGGPIEIFHDYEGVGKWAKAEWRANKQSTKKYQEIARPLYLKGLVTFTWCKGHSGNKWNDRADELCRVAMREDDKRCLTQES